MRLDRDLLARIAMVAALLFGAAGLSWGVWKANDAASEGRTITGLLAQHTRDLKTEQEENEALSGAVLYVEQSVAAVCAETHAACPAPPVKWP